LGVLSFPSLLLIVARKNFSGKRKNLDKSLIWYRIKIEINHIKSLNEIY